MHRPMPLVACVVLGAGHAAAQCYSLSPFDAAPGIHGGPSGRRVNDAALWDPDGPGPRAPVLVVVGGFSTVGPHLSSSGVAAWNGQGWEPLAFPGAFPQIWTVAAGPNGELAIGGASGTGTAGGAIALRTANGWDRITGSGSGVYDLAFTRDGSLLAAGSFRSVGGAAAANIARRVGGSWSALGSGLNGSAETVAETATGEIVTGGSFTTAGGVPTQHIARFDGSAWSALGDGVDGPVIALLPRPDGSLVAAGVFSHSGSTPLANIGAWDGSAWGPMGDGLPGVATSIYALGLDDSGGVFAGGDLALPTGPTKAARWDGQTWTDIGRDMDGLIAAFLPSREGPLGRRVYAAGWFSAAGGWPAFGVASWADDGWRPTTTRPYSRSLTALAARGGELLAAGYFYTHGEDPAYRIAARVGDGWTLRTTGVDRVISALLPMPDGSILAGGEFSTAGGVPALRIARWDGARWTQVGDGLAVTTVQRLVRMPDGRVVAAGASAGPNGSTRHRLSVWDGSAWRTIIDNVIDLFDMVVLPSGDLAVSAGNNSRTLRLWNGSAWRAQQTPLDIRRMVVDGAGDLYAAGYASRSTVMRSDGSAWSTVGHGLGFFDPPTVMAPRGAAGILLSCEETVPELGIRGILRSDGDSLVPANADPLAPYHPSRLAALPDGTFGFVYQDGEFGWLTPDGPGDPSPRFTVEPPERVLACPGTTVTLTAEAVADGPVEYTWCTGVTPEILSRVVGTGPTITVAAPATGGNSDYYWCTASVGPCASAQTRAVRVCSRELDQNRDGVVDEADGDAFLARFESGSIFSADFNQDGIADFFDLLDFFDALDLGC